MEKIWLNSYPPGVPAEINPDAYQSLNEVFEKSCRNFYDLPAFYSLGTTLSFSEIDRYSRDFAAYLQNELKLQKGDRLAIMLPNVLQYPIAMFGALRAGVIIVNVNPLYTVDELTYQMRDSGAKAIIALANFASTVQASLPKLPELKHVIITEVGDMLSPIRGWVTNFSLKYIYKKVPAWNIPHAIQFKDLIAKGEVLPFTKVDIANQDIAFLQYTGGTTGISKGAMLTHRNIIANIQQADAWFRQIVTEGKEIIITALPLYHIFSLTANCLYFSKIGGLNILIANPRDIRGMIKEMNKFKFSAITGVNTLFNGLLKNPKFAALDFSKLRLTLGGGMAVQRVVAEKWQAITGSALSEAYGLTETSPCVSMNPTNIKSYNGTIGVPVPSTDVRLFDDEGYDVPLGKPGELAVKGPQVMKGYWNNPSETEKVFTKDGWLLTGDVASMDDKGFLRILERKKDMILVSGFNVYPNEIEGVLARMAGIREVAVIGVPDENSGEVVKAFIVKENPELTEEAVIHFARQHLTPYKVPRHVEFRDELPKSNVGKILRRALRDGLEGDKEVHTTTQQTVTIQPETKSS